MKLSFRVKGLNPEIKRRIYVLAAVFLISLVFFEVVLNYRKSNKESVMDSATLPTVSMEAFDVGLNELHGYTTEMNACYMRDAIVPLDESRILPVEVNTDGYPITGMSYEIRSLDTERKIAETEVTDYSMQGNTLTAKVKVENLVEAGEEYLFILMLKSSRGDLRYYTRIMLSEDSHEKECLEFARYFHEMALGDEYSQLSSYVETSQDSNTDTLARVTIHSTLDQIGWDGFDGVISSEPVIEIKDINSSYVALEFYYQMKRAGDNGSDEYYNVTEYFKIRYTPERMYLLDYARDMEQILTPGHILAEGNMLSLGIVRDDLHYLSNETGTIVSFVQAGELYQYNQNKGELMRIFSFLGDRRTDPRNNYREHNILILNIDESGTMDFAVYGYMNSGKHEGQCGINLYHYDSMKRQTIEQVFVATTDSYQILNANFSKLLYETDDGQFYLMVGETLVKIDLDTLKMQEFLTNLHDGSYAVSESGRYIAWIEGEDMAGQMSVMDLETGTTRKIEAQDQDVLKPLAFMEEDLVYGIARESDIGYDAAGTLAFPMYHLYIVDCNRNFEVLKEYHKDGFYVKSAVKDMFSLTLERLQRQGETYVDAPSDTIKNSSGEKNKAVSIQRTADQVLGEITTLAMAEVREETGVVGIVPQDAGFVSVVADKTISISAAEAGEKYFVYMGSRVVLVTENLNKAIASADENMGIVINHRQQYLWKRGKKAYVNAFTNIAPSTQDAEANASARCISAMLVREGENVEVHQLLEQGETPIQVLQNTLKDTITVLDLTGCTLNQVLYYVSQGNPVYARTGEDGAALIVGYDAANVILYDPQRRTVGKMGLQDATVLFDREGRVFISYIHND